MHCNWEVAFEFESLYHRTGNNTSWGEAYLYGTEAPGKVDILPPVDALVIDGLAMIHRLAPVASTTIKEYIDDKVLPYLLA